MTPPKIVRYVISGATAALANLGLFFILVHFLAWQYLIASATAFSIGIATSFLLQKFWTFRDRNTAHMHSQLAVYLCITIANLLLNTFLVYAFVTWFGIWYLLAQLFAGALIAFISYVLYREFVFTSEEAG